MTAAVRMRAVVQTGYGHVRDAVHVTEVDAREPGVDEVEVAVFQACLNRKDLFALAGLQGPGIRPLPPLPHVGGADGAGTVIRTGAHVRSLTPGDRVVVYGGLHCGTCEWCTRGEQSACVAYGVIGEQAWGCLAERVVVPARNLLRLPDTVTWHQAAAVNASWVTAWNALVRAAMVRAGETVLVTAASGGVGTGAIRIARLSGCRVIAVVGAAGKVERVRAVGADLVLLAEDDWVTAVKETTAGRGVEVAIDSVGAATWPHVIDVLAPFGRMVVCGATSGDAPVFSIRTLYQRHRRILGAPLGRLADAAAVLAAVASGRLQPVVHARLPVERVRDGLEMLARREAVGKVVIEMAGDGRQQVGDR